LFKLYNGDHHGKNVGQSFHQRNKQLHDKKLATGWTPAAPDPPKQEYIRPQVSYPKFGKQRPASSSAPIHHIPRRKPAEVILTELEEEKQRQKEARPPPPKGPLLDSAEKERLALAMRYRGKLPKASPEELEEAARHRGVRRNAPRTEREEVQALFDAVMYEIEERRAFLADLEQAGALKRDHVHQVRAEIQTRVDDLNKLDRMLRDLDLAERAEGSR